MKKVCWIIILSVSAILLLSSCQNDPPVSEETLQQKKVEAARVNVRLGMAYFKRKEMQRAKQKLLLALEESPQTPETWHTMGYFLEKTGNTSEAHKYYQKALQLAAVNNPQFGRQITDPTFDG